MSEMPTMATPRPDDASAKISRFYLFFWPSIVSLDSLTFPFKPEPLLIGLVDTKCAPATPYHEMQAHAGWHHGPPRDHIHGIHGIHGQPSGVATSTVKPTLVETRGTARRQKEIHSFMAYL